VESRNFPGHQHRRDHPVGPWRELLGSPHGRYGR
jgi:hypothetical protein